jgi:hypothetical protein
MMASEADQHIVEIQRIENLQDRLESDDKYDFNTVLPDLENLFLREMRLGTSEMQDLFGCTVQILQELQEYFHLKSTYEEDLRNENSRHEVTLNQLMRDSIQYIKSLDQSVASIQDLGDRGRVGMGPYTRPFVSPMVTDRSESARRPSSLQRLMTLKLKSGVASRETSASRETPADSSVIFSSVGKDSRLDNRENIRRNEHLQTELESLKARLNEKDHEINSKCKLFESKSKSLEFQFDDFKRLSNETCKRLESEVSTLELRLKQALESSSQSRSGQSLAPKDEMIKKLREENQLLQKEKYTILYNLEEKEQALSAIINENNYHKRLSDSKKAEVEKLQKQLLCEAERLAKLESEKASFEEKFTDARAKYYEEINKLRIQLKTANEKPAIKSRFCSTTNMNIEIPQTTNSDSQTKETHVANSKLKIQAKPAVNAFNKLVSLAGKTWEERKNLIHGNPDDDDNSSQKSIQRSVGRNVPSVSTQKKPAQSKSGSDSNVEEDLSSNEEESKEKVGGLKSGPKAIPSNFKGATPRMMQGHAKHNHQSMSVPRSSSNNAEIGAKATISPGVDYKQRYVQIKTKLEGLTSKLAKRESQVGHLKREVNLAKQDYRSLKEQRDGLKEQLVERERVMVQLHCREAWQRELNTPKSKPTEPTDPKSAAREDQVTRELRMRVKVGIHKPDM